MIQNYTREMLIQLCVDSVVSYKEWNNRDSYSAQVNVSSIYDGLTAGCEYDYDIRGNTIWISFKNITEEQKERIRKGKSLYIDDLDDYFEEFGYDEEMFDGGGGISFYGGGYHGGYLPTRERLEGIPDGADWY